MRILLALLLTGCLEAPDVGPPQAPLCLDDDSDPAVTVRFSDVREVIGEYCINCHSPTGMRPLGYEVGGLDLSTYTTVRAGGARAGAGVIVAGRPCESVIFLKVSPAPPFGSRMPFGFPPIDDQDLQIIHDWIAEGARDN